MGTFVIGRPASGEYGRDFDRYVLLVPESDILAVLVSQKKDFQSLLSAVGKDREGYRYAEGKWSIRQVVGHVIDAERVFGYRAMCIARGETTPLPSFDEVPYADAAGSDDVPLAALLEEFRTIRESHELLFRHFPPQAWQRMGHAGGSPATPRGIAYVMAGHARHHAGVLAERYLSRR